jgi:hypothetical protein
MRGASSLTVTRSADGSSARSCQARGTMAHAVCGHVGAWRGRWSGGSPPAPSLPRRQQLEPAVAPGGVVSTPRRQLSLPHDREPDRKSARLSRRCLHKRREAEAAAGTRAEWLEAVAGAFPFAIQSWAWMMPAEDGWWRPTWASDLRMHWEDHVALSEGERPLKVSCGPRPSAARPVPARPPPPSRV